MLVCPVAGCGLTTPCAVHGFVRELCTLPDQYGWPCHRPQPCTVHARENTSGGSSGEGAPSGIVGPWEAADDAEQRDKSPQVAGVASGPPVPSPTVFPAYVAPWPCAYCGRPTRMPPYIDQLGVWLACCAEEACTDRWAPVAQPLPKRGRPYKVDQETLDALRAAPQPPDDYAPIEPASTEPASLDFASVIMSVAALALSFSALCVVVYRLRDQSLAEQALVAIGFFSVYALGLYHARRREEARAKP